MNRAAHYLMLSIPNTAAGFRITNGSDIYSTSLVLKPAKPVDEMALLLLPTRAKHLPTGLSAADSVEAAILDSADPAVEESYSAVVRLLCLAHPDWVRDSPKPRSTGLPPVVTQTCPPGALVNRVIAAIGRARSPHEKSQLWGLLVRWHVQGSVLGYFESLQKLLGDPNVYSDGEEQSPYWGLVEGVNDETYEFDDLLIEPGSDNVRDLLSARNPTLAIYWMHHWGGPETDDQLRSFAALLDWQDQRVQYEVAEILAGRMRDPDHAPKLYATVRGEEVPYPDLKEVVAYWKKRFRIDQSPNG